jgi:hypothetical protein
MRIQTIQEAGKIFGAALEGDRAAQGRIKAVVDGSAYITESFASSDLAAAFQIGTTQKLQAQYAQLTPTWTDFATRLTFTDFRPQFLRELLFDDDIQLTENGGEETMPGSLPNIPEGTEYPMFGFTTSAAGVALSKKGARFGFGWEMVINDEWNTISQIPGELVRYASRTEDTQAYGILVSKTGPNATTFRTENGNLNATGTLFNKEYKLSLDALVLAKKAIRARRVNGRKVSVPRFRLIVPTSMRDQAEYILGIQELTIRNAGNTTEVKAKTSNSDVALTSSDWLEEIDQSASAGTTWYLVPDKGFDGTRKSLAVAFLQNNERPDLRISSDTGKYIGGGEVPGLEGSLLNDSIEYRIRHVVSGAFLNGQALLASKGTEAAAAPSQFNTP